MLAVAFFVGGHFALSSVSVRPPLVRLIGEGGFRALYSVVALATLVWAVMAYRAAPYVGLWHAGMTLKHIPVVLMPFASILAVAGLTTRNVTAVGGESMVEEPDTVTGIITVTRHPFLWGALLWSLGHIAANGDLASVVFFGGFGILAAGGMAHIDYRRRFTMGPAWGPIAMTTSAIPFLAAVEGRKSVDWRGIGWARIAGGVVLFFLLLAIHPWIAGVPLLPDSLVSFVR